MNTTPTTMSPMPVQRCQSTRSWRRYRASRVSGMKVAADIGTAKVMGAIETSFMKEKNDTAMEQVEMMCDAICLVHHGRSVLAGDLRAIKKSYGKNTVRIEYTGDSNFLDLPELVEKLNHFGAVVEVKLRPGADPQEILKAAVARGVRLTRFELMEPPLNDIFIEKVSEAHA